MINSKNSIVIKYGGNAMIDEPLKRSILKNVVDIHKAGKRIVIVHGGGPFINAILDKVQIQSEFIGGHRKTTPEAMKYIEMALKGEVNTSLVGLVNSLGAKAVGLSGKDGGMITTKKRFHYEGEKQIDLGQVADVATVQPEILNDLLDKGYIPIVACVSADKDGISYNINADMMAGAIAGALKAEYLVLTDVDGIRRDKNDPESLITEVALEQIPEMMESAIVGGMIPKIESCQQAIEAGSKRARIINGTKPEQLIEAINTTNQVGTTITK